MKIQNRRHEDRITERCFFLMKWIPITGMVASIAVMAWSIALLEFCK